MAVLFLVLTFASNSFLLFPPTRLSVLKINFFEARADNMAKRDLNQECLLEFKNEDGVENIQMTGMAGCTSGQRKAYLWSLVLSSVRIPHIIVRQGDAWIIQVPFSIEDTARQEIAAFEQENENWPPPSTHGVKESPHLSKQQPSVVFLMGLMVIFHAVTGPWSSSSDWFQYGAVANRRILEAGEWWRVITGLTLHADPVHVLGNVFIGGLLAYFLCRLLGNGLGWLLILLSGAMGNALNVILRGGSYQSVGFSTAVFGAVGILSGLQMGKVGSLKRVLLSLGAAVSLLAFLGTEGERVDLGAHLWGLVSGIALGLLVVNMPGFLKRIVVSRYQFVLQISAGALVLGAWLAALYL